MRLALSVGHGQAWEGGAVVDDPGAEHAAIGVSEFKTCKRIHHVLHALLYEYHDISVFDVPINIPLQQRIQTINDAHMGHEIDLAIEIHNNGFDDRAVDGTETLYWPTSVSGKAWAQKVQEFMVAEIGITDRGVKAFGDDKWEQSRDAFLQMTKMPAIIVEPFFITSDASAKEVLTGDLIHRVSWSIFKALIT